MDALAAMLSGSTGTLILLGLFAWALADVIRTFIPQKVVDIDSGRVVFMLVPLCAIFVAVLAKHFGQLPDSVANLNAIELGIRLWLAAMGSDAVIRQGFGKQPTARAIEAVVAARQDTSSAEAPPAPPAPPAPVETYAPRSTE